MIPDSRVTVIAGPVGPAVQTFRLTKSTKTSCLNAAAPCRDQHAGSVVVVPHTLFASCLHLDLIHFAFLHLAFAFPELLTFFDHCHCHKKCNCTKVLCINPQVPSVKHWKQITVTSESESSESQSHQSHSQSESEPIDPLGLETGNLEFLLT